MSNLPGLRCATQHVNAVDAMDCMHLDLGTCLSGVIEEHQPPEFVERVMHAMPTVVFVAIVVVVVSQADLRFGHAAEDSGARGNGNLEERFEDL